MESAGTAWYIKKPTTRFAQRVCSELLESGNRSVYPVLCPNTGKLFLPDVEWQKVQHLSIAVEGAHFLAFGYYYLLCIDTVTNHEFVEVYREKDQKLVGRVYKADEMHVSTY